MVVNLVIQTLLNSINAHYYCPLLLSFKARGTRAKEIGKHSFALFLVFELTIVLLILKLKYLLISVNILLIIKISKKLLNKGFRKLFRNQ